MKMISLMSAAALLTGASTLAIAQQVSGSANTTTATSASTDPANANATFGMEVRALAHSHQNDATHHGIGATVSAKAHARNASRPDDADVETKVSAKVHARKASHPDDGDVEASGAPTTTSSGSLDTKARGIAALTAAKTVAAAQGANRDISEQKGVVAALRTTVRSDVAETRGNMASTHADVAATRAQVAATHADVAATVAQAKSIRAAVAAVRPGH